MLTTKLCNSYLVILTVSIRGVIRTKQMRSIILQKLSLSKHGIIGHELHGFVVSYSYRTGIIHVASFCMVLHDNYLSRRKKLSCINDS